MSARKPAPFWGTCYGGRVHLIMSRSTDNRVVAHVTGCGATVFGSGRHPNVVPASGNQENGAICPECVAKARELGLTVIGRVNVHGASGYPY